MPFPGHPTSDQGINLVLAIVVIIIIAENNYEHKLISWKKNCEGK